MQDVLDDVGLEQRVDVEPLAVLRRDEHALDLDRALAPVLVHLVADRHLRLAVRPQVGQHVGLAHLGEPLADPVRERDRERHQLVGLAARVAEHHPLVAGADAVERIVVARVVLHLVGRVDALRDVGRLLVDRDDHAAGVGVEAVLGAVVADLAHLRCGRGVGMSTYVCGRDLAGDDDEAGRDERLAGDAARRVVGEDGVEDGVRDLVGDLVRMALGDRLGGEGEAVRAHWPKGSRRTGDGNYSPFGRRPIREAASSCRLCALEDPADRLGDRQLDPEAVREVAEDRRRRQPLDDLADLGGRLVRGRAARDQLAGAAVAAEAAPARDHQVAHPGEAGERLGPRAAGRAEPGHLGDAARDHAAFALSPSSSPSTPPAASAITFFAAPQNSTPIRSVFT